MLLTSWTRNRLGITYRKGAKTGFKVTGASRPDGVIFAWHVVVDQRDVARQVPCPAGLGARLFEDGRGARRISAAAGSERGLHERTISTTRRADSTSLVILKKVAPDFISNSEEKHMTPTMFRKHSGN